MFLVAFYALLVDGRRLVDWIEYVSPLPELQTLELLGQFRRVSGSVLGSSLITAIAQSAAATVGYLVAGVPNPFFFALLTFFASFLPSVGTAIIAFPLVGLLAVMGQVWQPIFLAAWALVVVGLVDNLLKPLLIRSGMELHGVIVFFSLIGGVLVFGAIGLLAGPLIVSFFLAMVRFARRDFQASAAPL
jgi:predicted PurR-regulated permease PerM